MEEVIINIEEKLVRVGFSKPLNLDQSKEDLYKVVMESKDFFAVIEHALGLGYTPETFRQTIHSGADAHFRLKSVQSSNKDYARIISLMVEDDVMYRLYVPHP